MRRRPRKPAGKPYCQFPSRAATSWPRCSRSIRAVAIARHQQLSWPSKAFFFIGACMSCARVVVLHPIIRIRNVLKLLSGEILACGVLIADPAFRFRAYRVRRACCSSCHFRQSHACYFSVFPFSCVYMATMANHQGRVQTIVSPCRRVIHANRCRTVSRPISRAHVS